MKVFLPAPFILFFLNEITCIAITLRNVQWINRNLAKHPCIQTLRKFNVAQSLFINNVRHIKWENTSLKLRDTGLIVLTKREIFNFNALIYNVTTNIAIKIAADLCPVNTLYFYAFLY
jgi:hypothetical protein